MVSILNEYQKIGLEFDRTTGRIQELPYSKEDLLIAPNEFVKSATLNKKFYYLHYNFLYLYKLCNFGNFKIPTSTNFTFSANDNLFFETRFKKNLPVIKNEIQFSKKGAVSFYKPKLSGTVLFYITDKNLFSITIDRDFAELTTKTSFIDPLSGTIEFSNITDVKTTKGGNLYVVDNGYKNLHLYNAFPVIDGEVIYRKLPFLKNVIGGIGPQEENTKFNNINNIAVNENFVIIEDDVNKCFKVTDSQLNWLNTISLKTFFDNIKSLDTLIIDEFNNVFGIKHQTLYKFKLDDSFNLELKETVDISSYIKGDEKVLSAYFSQQNKLIFYVITNKGIKKVWSTDSRGCIGEFIPGEEIEWGSSFYLDEMRDSLILKTKTPEDQGCYLLGYEDSLVINSLLTNRDFEIFGFNEIQVNHNEYTSNWSFQKAFKKLYFNLTALLREVKFRLVENDDNIKVIVDRVYNQVFLNYQNTFVEPSNLNIGINEIFQAEVINRLFDELYTLQLTILLYIINNNTTKKFFSPSPEKLNKTAITYTYYGDESVNINPDPAKLNPFENLIPLDGITISLGGAPFIGSGGISIIDGIIN